MTKEIEESRNKLLVVGSRLFAQFGLDGTTTRDIANEAQLNVSLISYYFGGKEGLYRTVIEEFATNMKIKVEELTSKVQYDRLDQKVFHQVMVELLDLHINQKLEFPNIAIIFQRELLSRMPYAKETISSTYISISTKVISLLAEGQKKGFLRKELNPTFIFILMSEAVNAYFLRVSCSDAKMTPECFLLPKQKEEFRNQVLEIFLKGIMK